MRSIICIVAASCHMRILQCIRGTVAVIFRIICSMALFQTLYTPPLSAQDDTEKLGRFTFSIGTPPVNNIHFSTPDSTLNETGLVNLTAGIGYYYNDKNYLEFVASGSYAPILTYYNEDHYRIYALSFSLTNNHVIHSFLQNRLHYITGINYTFYRAVFSKEPLHWEYPREVYHHADIPNVVRNKETIGLTAGLRCRVVRNFLAGIRWNASVYTLDEHKFEYNHIGYLDVIIRFGSKRD